MIVSIHGIDAAGKATQVAAIAAALRPMFQHHVIHTFDFPRYQSTMGQVIGRVLRGETLVVPDDEVKCFLEAAAFEDGPRDDGLNTERLARSWSADKAHLIQAAMVVNRFEHLNMLRLAQHEREILVLDRYWLDGVVYGQVDGIDRDWLINIHEALPPPDLAVYLDITVEESFKRRPDRRDYYEKNADKLTRVRELYKDEISRLNAVENYHRYGRYTSLYAMQPTSEITSAIVQQIAKLILG